MESLMISSCRNLAILLLGPLACAGQEQGTPTFRANITLIEFSLVALDTNGKPVTDLKKDEIRIDESGKYRDVAFFRFARGGATDQIDRLPPGDFSNQSDRVPSVRRNLSAIVFDTINTAPVGGGFGPLQESNYQETTRAQMLHYEYRNACDYECGPMAEIKYAGDSAHGAAACGPRDCDLWDPNCRGEIQSCNGPVGGNYWRPGNSDDG